MKIVQLRAENFKRLVAVEIRPDGNIVEIKGKNGAGKSSVLDAIWVALAGRAAAPPEPIRDGEEACSIELDTGDVKITRRFHSKEGGRYTDTLKVVDEDGRAYPKPQSVIDGLLGAIGFDPFAFVGLKPDDQAEMLLDLVPLSIDLDELAEADEADRQKRRDKNRDAKALMAQIEAIPEMDRPEKVGDRDALMNKLSNAAETNSAIEAERQRRGARDNKISDTEATIADLEKRLKDARDLLDELQAEKRSKKPLDEPINTTALREEIAAADQAQNVIAQIERRAQMVADHGKLAAESEALTKQLSDRDKAREKALADADMPIDGLGIETVDGKRFVTFDGHPFQQISTAEQLRASTAIAMACNPELRVLQIKDGSLLDQDSMTMLADLADAEDFQLWIERVGDEDGVGIVIENGEIREGVGK